MEKTVFVYTTWPSPGEAEAAGRVLVERKLCACVNIIPGMTSLYSWQGRIERAEEAVMILKTQRGQVQPLMAAVKAAHPYDTPAIVELPAGAADPDFAAWIARETGG
jgi:periplasmic divalent cation tolerance protein